MTGPKRRRRQERFPCRYKRDRCCVRSWKKNAANCLRNRCGSREDSETPNSTEDAETRSVGTAVQQFSNDEDEDENKDGDEDNEKVKTFDAGLSCEVTTDFCKNYESSNCIYDRGKEMQTITEEDLDFPYDEDGTLREINGHEEGHRTAENRPKSCSRTSNQTNPNIGNKLLHYPAAHCDAGHKCGRCSRRYCYDDGVRVVSAIGTARPERIRPCTRGLCCARNCEVSLDAFRPCRRFSARRDSFLWKMATAIYEISGILKDGLVKLLAEDGEAEKSAKSSPRDAAVCENGRQGERGICTRTRGSGKHNDGPRTRTEAGNRSGGATERPTGRNSANCEASDGYVRPGSENDLFNASRGEKSPGRLRRVEGASVCRVSKMRRSAFPPKTTSSDSSISSLSSYSSFKYACNAREQDCGGVRAPDYCKQDIGGRPTSEKSELGMNRGDSTSSDETTVVNGFGISKNVYLPLSARTEPEEIYEIEDSGESRGPGDLAEHSDENRRRRLARDLVGRVPCPRGGRGFRDEIYCGSQKGSETDSATSRRKRRRRFKSSGRGRAGRGSSRSNCRGNITGRNYCTVEKITRGVDCRGELQPYETGIQSRLEYFREVEEITLEPSCSQMTRSPRSSGRRFSRSGGSAEGESRRWDRELLAEANVGRRIKRNSTCCGAQSTSHHFYM